MKNLEALYDYLELKRFEPFAWGTNDCCEFARGAEEAMYGDSLFDDLRGDYTDAEGAFAFLQSAGYETLVDMFNDRLESIDVNFAQRGDLISHPVGDTESVGICVGDSIVTVGDNGIEFIPITAALKAWRFRNG